MASLRFNLPAHTNFNPCSSQCSFLSHRQFRSNDYLFVANVLFPSSPPKKYALHSASRNSRKLGFVSRRRGNSVGVRCTSDISSTEVSFSLSSSCFEIFASTEPSPNFFVLEHSLESFFSF
eukprot:TRINITY_DN366_c0_g1_i1.p1 TRINITY_DN366_c0_g1~~TRINITY_DN366_c0_g1_i1.p1  ORF type:complete len:121 (+),score=0.61 TRINITY_DN366_c0_g1_i1:167-529(+)